MGFRAAAAMTPLVVAVFLVYALFWPAVTGDMRNFLLPWLDTILERGRIGAFAAPFSNYTPPYLYLLSLFSLLAGLLSKMSVVKALAVAGALLLGAAALRLARTAGAPSATLTVPLWTMLLPSVVINAAGMGQCDAFWAAASLMAVVGAVERRPTAMLVWFGVAIAFKAQAIFLAPFILQRLLSDRTPIWLWPLPGLVYWAAMLPALVAGWPAGDLATVYLRQAEWNPEFISNAANPWSLVQLVAPVEGVGSLWLGHVAAALAVVAYLAAYGRRDFDAPWLIALALLAAIIVPFLLPKMHERFFFLADILAFVLALVGRDRRSILLFLLVQGASVLALAGLLLAQPLLPIFGAVLLVGAMALIVGLLRTGADSPATGLTSS